MLCCVVLSSSYSLADQQHSKSVKNTNLWDIIYDVLANPFFKK